MTEKAPERFDDVSVICKANIFFEGKVISHTVLFKDGSKKTIGVIQPGSYKFNTDAPEKMEITAGNCMVRQAGIRQWNSYAAGNFFQVPGQSFFEIVVDGNAVEYICSFG
ncbi:MAG TPA: pyrimidine/purine nucleoside phosphorylase [Syntrophales bacterium]|nr:pyrimidine/purine nucleoside phosphorylase [Syntrophales bacterium]